MRSMVAALVCCIVSMPVLAPAGQADHGGPTHVAEAVAVPPSAGELGGTLLVVLLGAGLTIWLAALIRDQLPSAE